MDKTYHNLGKPSPIAKSESLPREDKAFVEKGLDRYKLEVVINSLIQQCKKNKQFFSIFYIDINNFDYTNQLLGFEKGDLLLQQLADRFIHITKRHYWFGRLMGDEFICISHFSNEKTNKQNKVIIKSFFDALKNPFTIDNKEFQITASIGVSSFPEGGTDSNSMIQSAKIALKEAKLKTGNAFIYFNAKLWNKTKRELEIDAQLKKINMDEELRLVYQPQIDIKTKKIAGAEALIRWKHHTLGELSPKDFCPIATKNGIIVDISFWVIEKVAKLINILMAENIPTVPISINIPTTGFYKKNFIQKLKKTIKKYSVKPQNIRLETTENVILKNISFVINEISELNRLGFKVILDDFGTGFSNLSYLSQFKLFALKIDMSFIKRIHRSWRDTALVKIIVQIAKNFNLLVIAEGAETIKQVNTLKKLGCDIIQGYYFSKPLEEEKFKSLLLKKDKV